MSAERPRPWLNPTPCHHLEPDIAGQFDTFEDWVNHATRCLTGKPYSTGSLGRYGDGMPAMCIDNGHGIALDAEGILRRGGVARIGGQGDAAGFRFLVLIVIGPEESRLGDPAEADAEGHSDVWRSAQIIRGAEEP